MKPGRPFWHMLNTPYLERLAAAGARADEIDLVMCTHLHHDHVGWNTINRDGKWVPTFPNARYVFSKPDVDYFSGIDADPNEGPAELGTFRECVVPILDAGKADIISGGATRLNDFIEIAPAPGHAPGHVVFKLESKRERGVFIGDVLHHLMQVHYPDWNFPKNSDAAQAIESRRRVLARPRRYRSPDAARPCRRAIRRPDRKNGRRLSARFCGLNAFGELPVKIEHRLKQHLRALGALLL